MGRSVGVDLGGTKILAVVVDGGRVVERVKLDTPRTGSPDDVLDAVAKAVRQIDLGGSDGPVGVGVPGPVFPGTGVVPAAPNLPNWSHDVAVADGLSERLGGRKVLIGNDCNLSTLAEYRLGAGRGADDLLGLFVGTGVGAGLVLDGVLRQGRRGLAGEIGHTFVSFPDLADGVGVGRGELEDYSGRAALQERVELADPTEAATLQGLRRKGRIKSSAWEQALDQNDPLARRLVAEAGSALAAAIASVVALLDLDRVVLGGGFAGRLGEPFRRQIELEVHARGFAGATAAVVHSELGDLAGALGAALLPWEPQ